MDNVFTLNEGTVIDKDKIIGIGPLMYQISNDTVMKSLYKAYKMFYMVHLSTTSLRIESNWFYREGIKNDDQAEMDKQAMEWEKGYEGVKNNIIDILNNRFLRNA